MINPIDLQTNIVAVLQAIPDLVDFVGDAGEIRAYDDESIISGHPDTAEFSLMGRAILVTWQGADLPRTGETRGWKHSFRIALKAESIQSYYTLAQLIMDGIPSVPAGDGFNSFLNTTIHLDCDGIQDAEVLPTRSADGVGRLFIQFSLYER